MRSRKGGFENRGRVGAEAGARLQAQNRPGRNGDLAQEELAAGPVVRFLVQKEVRQGDGADSSAVTAMP